MNYNFSYQLGAYACGALAVAFAVVPLSSSALSLPSVSSIPAISSVSGSSASSDVAVAANAQLRGVCLMLAPTKVNIDKRISAAGAKYQKDAQIRITAVATEETQIKNQDAAARKASDAKFTAYIASLSKKATTDVQKEAVRVFASRIREATQARRSTVDGASLSYVQGSRALITQRQSAVLDTAQKLQTEMQQQFETAKASCEAGADPKVVRDSLKSHLDATQSTYVTKLQDQSTVKADIASLASERALVVADANRVFAQVLAKASQDLSVVIH